MMGPEETSFYKVLALGAGGLSSITRIHVEKQSRCGGMCL